MWKQEEELGSNCRNPDKNPGLYQGVTLEEVGDVLILETVWRESQLAFLIV